MTLGQSKSLLDYCPLLLRCYNIIITSAIHSTLAPMVVNRVYVKKKSKVLLSASQRERHQVTNELWPMSLMIAVANVGRRRIRNYEVLVGPETV